MDIQGETPEGAFAGDVTVVPAWDHNETHIPVYGEIANPVRVVPTHLVFNLKDAADTTTETSFIVMMNEPDPGVEVEDSLGKSGVLAVGHVDAHPGPAGRIVKFSLRLKPGKTITRGLHRLTIRSPRNKVDLMTVTVSVSLGGA